MRWRPLLWFLLSLLFFIGAAIFWQLGDRWAAEAKSRSAHSALPTPHAPPPTAQPQLQSATERAPGANFAPQALSTNREARVARRLSNTSKPLGELMRSEHAILLENALLDTTQGTQLPIPEHLKAQGEPGSYIVQSRRALDDGYRSLLKQAGASIVSYIPNNAYLVRASAAAAQQLAGDPRTQSVLAYAPYFKLKEPLLKAAVEQTPMPEDTTLNVVLFADAAEKSVAELKKLGAEVVGGDLSPFGPVVKLKPTADSLATLAGMPGVKEVELARSRRPANDLSRPALGISEDTQTNVNYLGLSGANVLVNINDMGVDTNHPDLAGRVMLDTNDVNRAGGVDKSGHGTFEASIIAGSGAKSDTVTNAQGSIMPGVAGQFRGKAPGATLLSLSHSAGIPQRTYENTVIGGFLDVKAFGYGSVPDFYLQQTAARAHALISNNGWNYENADYDISAANFDAAVRDSLPLTNGSQPLLYVFSAGNYGNAADNGEEGFPDSILSPATAKNVITVGALEQFRNITNKVAKQDFSAMTNGVAPWVTNQPWTAQSDSTTEVASFSSRGNVGIGLESDFGRFKPDVVAPGSWVISARSGQWDEQAYYNPTSHIYATYRYVVANTNAIWQRPLFIPANTVGLDIWVSPDKLSPYPFPPMPIYLSTSGPVTNGTPLGNDAVSLPRDMALAPLNSVWWYGVGNSTNQAVVFDVHTDISVTNELGNYLDVLSNLNNTLGPYYRYESGSSMAAASVSGTLALMEEFFTQRLHLTNSPALMKALLINGARPLGAQYDFKVQKALNSQGWGQVSLPTSLPGGLTNSSPTTGAPMLFFDQNPANALATGQSYTYTVKTSDEGQIYPLLVTLVWTDPPGDPAAATKLVNDLDLIVTNLDTGDVYYGNDIPADTTYNSVWDTNTVPNVDMVNNVENVYLPPFLGTNYSITVVGRRVNVSAVTARPDNITQDYALVISAGYGQVNDALTLTASGPVASVGAPLITFMTNSFVGNPNYSGGVLTNQHVGANPPLLGTNQLALVGMNPNPWGSGANGQMTLGVSNQWHFFVMTNENGFTNAAFMTLETATLSVPRIGATDVINPENATRTQPDIDLYVSTDPNLLALDNNAISNAVKSLTRAGDETIVISNAVKGVYYIGVKSEDQMAAQFTFVGVFSLLPFSSSDANGNQLLQGFVVPAAIPDAYFDNAGRIQPGIATIYAIAPIPLKVHRAIVTNIITHEAVGDLYGTLTHGTDSADLNNHTTNSMVVNQFYIYDDSMEHNVPGAHQTDGPQTLHNFAGKEGSGQWVFRQSDTSITQIGVENDFRIFLEKQQDLKDGIIATIQPHSCREDFVDVPNNATNLTIKIAILGQNGSGPPPPDGPISITLCPLGGFGPSCKSLSFTNIVLAETNSLSIDIYDTPPLRGGTYSVMTCNLGNTPATVFLQAEITFNTAFAFTSVGSAGGPVVIQDDAVTYAYLTNRSHAVISGIDIGMLISDPRISDLGITLISPSGTRVLLMENRGAGSTNGLGSFVIGTNGTVMQSMWSTNLEAFWTSSFETAPVGVYTPGAVFEGWNVLSNSVLVYPQMPAPWLSNNVLMLEYGAVSNSLPTTNSTQYQLSFNVTHAPYLVGTVGWWPLNGDGADIFGGHDGLLSGDVRWSYNGEVDRAYFGDGVATRMVVPACPELNVGPGRGFTLEGWIAPPPSAMWANGFEGEPTRTLTAPAYFASGWHLDAGSVDLITTGSAGYGTETADSGTVYMDLNGLGPGTISTNLALIAGHTYRLSLAYAANEFGQPVTPRATISLDGNNLLTIASSTLAWQHTSVVFTASSPLVRLQVLSGTPGVSGLFLDSFAVTEEQASALNSARPLVEWNVPTNLAPQGVQFWLSGLPETNGPAGSLWANIWDTNLQPHTVAVLTNAITNGGWQHVALTYDAATFQARLYTNGHMAVAQTFATTNLVPRTLGDLYFGFDPALYKLGPSASTLAAHYKDFSSTAGLNLVGAATRVGSALRLTPAAVGLNGNAWLSTKQQCANGFDTNFKFQFSNQGGWPPGSDGMFFAVQNQGPAVPNFMQLGDTNSYVSVFFNTFMNWPGATDTVHWDVSDNSVGIVINGLYKAQTDLNDLNIHLKDGAVHEARVLYDGNTMTVWLDTVLVLDHIAVPTLKTVATDNTGSSWVGFGAGTGMGYQNHDILSWDFATATPGAVLNGGLDEFGLYERALTECEIAAIFQAGSAGKYGTNVLGCPLTNSALGSSITVQLDTGSGAQTFYFTNGLTWTNGPLWETDVLNFTNVLLFASTNGPATNLTSLVFSGCDPNTMVDQVVLSSVVTNYISGYLHFTDNTNLALLPIKYGPTPYTVSNFPPTLLFSNDFENVTQQVYQAGSLLPGTTNNPALGQVLWVVTNGPVTVVSNTLVDAVGTNCLALSTNGVLCTLPTVAGHRYQLTYTLRGPAAVAWWNGDTEPLSRRAWDLIGGNNGAYVNDATNNFRGFVGPHSFYFNGQMEIPPDPDIYPEDIDDPASAIEMADSANLKLTNSFTIEGWIWPLVQTNEAAYCGREQIFFRGFPDVFDCAGAGDPYWLALDEPADPMKRDLHFHIGNAQFGSPGFDLFTTNSPILLGDGTNNGWWHIAAVFERPFTNVTVLNTNTTNSLTFTTNAVRLYLNGVCILTNYTTLCPYADMDPAFSPGVAIGGRSRYDFTQPYRGWLDELTVYGRALTPPELAAIASLGGKGKADRSVAPALSLAKLNVSVDGVLYDTAYGDNARWTTRTVTFTAENANAVLALQSLLPGTLIDGVTLTEIPAELDYLPESPLDVLNGEDAYGVWTLELWDNRVGLSDVMAMLLNWQLNITASPTNPPPIITLQHGIPYTNTLVAHGVQNFIVPMPQWAFWSTNVLQFAQRHNNPANPLSAEVWFNTNQMPAFTTNDTLLLAGSFASTNLTTNTALVPYVSSGQTYYLAVTNPSGTPIDFAVGVWFDMTTLTNCQSQSNFVSAAGIPRYFQFDVPGDDLAAGLPLGNVNFWLSAAQTNLTMVLSQHLPLPDLTHYDYISQWPSTNNETLMVVSNSTPFAIQTNRWYVGVFNSGPTNVPFTIQACYVTNYPTLIELTNGVPYFASFAENTNQLAPPGPPRWVFFQFDVTNWTDGLLFELYGLSGNADLLLQRESLPTMAPYFAGSFRTSTNAEQVVVRTSPEIADLRGSWYLGIYNNEVTNVAYTIRAVTSAGSMLLSGQPLVTTASLMPSAPGNFLLQWNSILGEQYVVFYSDTLLPANWQPFAMPNGGLTATTPLSTVAVPIGSTGMRFYRVGQVPELPANTPNLLIQLSGTNQIRLSWPDSFVGYTLQYATGPFGPWLNLTVPVTDNLILRRWEAFDTIGTAPRYYRLIP
jgi:subtilisin-like proprotein convertase family protein